MTMKIRLAGWDELKEQSCSVRREVFVLEQKIPEEMVSDDMDQDALHVLAITDSGNVLGTGRLLPDGRIGRLAVLAGARGLGIGGHLLQHLMQAGFDRGDQRLELSANIDAEGFYTRYGFTRSGEEYTEAGIVHIEMEYLVS